MVQACDGNFKDHGLGANNGHYDILEEYTIQLCPEDPGEKLNIDFKEFPWFWRSSRMFLYDGDSTAADPITIFPDKTDNNFSLKRINKDKFYGNV